MYLFIRLNNMKMGPEVASWSPAAGKVSISRHWKAHKIHFLWPMNTHLHLSILSFTSLSIFFSLRYYWFFERYLFVLRLRLLITHTNCSVKRKLFTVACGSGHISLAIFLVVIFWFFIDLFICLFISFIAAVDSL